MGKKKPLITRKKMMTRIDLKMMDSKELRELRSLIRKELDFRAEIGQELEDGGIKEWVNWEDEADVRPIYNDVQMLNGSFEGDTISQIGKKHQKRKKV